MSDITVTSDSGIQASVTTGMPLQASVIQAASNTFSVSGALQGPKGDTGAAGTTDYTQLSNKPSLATVATTGSYTDLTNKPTIPTANSQLTNDSSYATTTALSSGLATKANTTHSHTESDVTGLTTDLAAKQATLVSGTNIKTINGTTLLGSGDITITGGTGGSSTLAGDTDVVITSPANKDLLTYDTASSKWTNQPAGSVAVPDATTTSKGIIELAGDLSGTAASPTVTATHLTAALPVAQGGTGVTTSTGSGSNVLATSPSLTTPKADIITDTNGGKEIELVATASSANWVKLTNTVAGSGVTVGVNGTGTNENLTLAAMGTGTVQVGGSQVTTAANTQTLTNKTLTAPVISSIVNTGTLTLPTTTGTVALTSSNITGTAANVTGTVAIANGGTGVATLPTGILKGAGTGAITAVTAPTGAIVGTTDTQTLSGKTLTTPIISSISNTGTLTLPTSTDTLVGRATTDTLTNKTLTSPVINTGTVGADPSAALGIASKQYVDASGVGASQSFTNISGAGGTFYYAKLGAIKMLWGQTAQQTIASAGDLSANVGFPTSFFTTVQSAQINIVGISGYRNWVFCDIEAVTTTGATVNSHNTGAGSAVVTFDILIIGT